MVNWPEVLLEMEHWADGFLTGAAAASLIAIVGPRSCCSLEPFKPSSQQLKRSRGYCRIMVVMSCGGWSRRRTRPDDGQLCSLR